VSIGVNPRLKIFVFFRSPSNPARIIWPKNCFLEHEKSMKITLYPVSLCTLGMNVGKRLQRLAIISHRMKTHSLGLSAFLLVSALGGLPICTHAATGDEHWDYRFGIPGADDGAMVIATHGGDMYVAGAFRSVAGVAASRVARFDGLRWSPLGNGIGSSSVYALAFQGDNVYAGGSFTSAGGVAVNNVARWDGTNWNALGSGVNNNVYAMATVGRYVYAGGMFTSAGGVAATNIARWDGTNWSALGRGVPGLVKTLATDGTNLFVGGAFTNAGGLTVNSVAVWDGANWSAFHGDPGTNKGIFTILVDGSGIYLGGNFSKAGGVPANNIVKWNGSGYEALGSGLTGTNVTIYAMACMKGDLYACGSFTNAGGVAVQNVARWNGSTWTNLAEGVTASPALPLLLYGLGTGPDGRLYIGGYFDSAGTLGVYDLAAWDGTNWQVVRAEAENGTFSFGSISIVNSVRAMAVNGNDLYASGTFLTAGTVKASRVARWDGTHWWALGSGMKGTNDNLNTTVSALAISGGYVYAGGNFTNAGGVTVTNIARWNGSSWSALGSSLDNLALAMAAKGSDVYVGGNFIKAGGVTANYIAKWNGSTWSALGSGLNGSVSAISVGSDGIYVGGNFTTAGGATANQVARWDVDGAAWHSLGNGTTNGVGGTVSAILPVSPTEVYVGGTFTTAGVVSANRIAKFDGTSWSALGSGMSGVISGVISPSVNALADDGTYLYAAGAFTNAGGTMVSSIARWDGASWTSLGSGLARLTLGGTGPIAGAGMALVRNGNDLYAGGMFVTAGGKVSSGIARWNGQTTFAPPAAMCLGGPSRSSDGSFQFRVTASSGVAYVVEASTDLATWLPMSTNDASPFKFSDPGATNGTYRFYRARQTQ
jgi:hypothetical protein